MFIKLNSLKNKFGFVIFEPIFSRSSNFLATRSCNLLRKIWFYNFRSSNFLGKIFKSRSSNPPPLVVHMSFWKQKSCGKLFIRNYFDKSLCHPGRIQLFSSVSLIKIIEERLVPPCFSLQPTSSI